MADFGTVQAPSPITLGGLIDSYLIYSAPVLYGIVLDALNTTGEPLQPDVISAGQLYPR